MIRPGCAVVTAGYLGAFVFLWLVLRTGMAVGVAYGIWGACGTAATAALAAVIFDDPLTLPIAVGIGLIIAGVLLVEFGSHPRGGRPFVVMWLTLAVAIVTEVVSTLALRASDGFRGGCGSCPSCSATLVSFTLLWVTLSLGMPVGIAYGIWTACGVAAGRRDRREILFGEPLTGDHGARHRADRRRRPHDRDGRPRPLSAPANTTVTTPASGTDEQARPAAPRHRRRRRRPGATPGTRSAAAR